MNYEYREMIFGHWTLVISLVTFTWGNICRMTLSWRKTDLFNKVFEKVSQFSAVVQSTGNAYQSFGDILSVRRKNISVTALHMAWGWSMILTTKAKVQRSWDRNSWPNLTLKLLSKSKAALLDIFPWVIWTTFLKDLKAGDYFSAVSFNQGYPSRTLLTEVMTDIHICTYTGSK